ncbi:DUF4434 domain-containing protein [Gryllotalpicola koreensis]|uniref:DUF4434 domain-containing protein n=1 Tax=Gryllotalpicola koreensis TaxID=993086 RepID=A0ABP8A081_9MICO
MSIITSVTSARGLAGAAAAVAALTVSLIGGASPAAASVTTRAAVPALSTTKTAAPAFRAAFWSPYFVDGSNDAAQIAQAMAAQKAAGDTDVIIEWSVHYDAGDAAYPAAASTGFWQWNDAVPQFIAAAKKAGMHVWLGLAVVPDSVNDLSKITNQTWLNAFAATQQKVADDLYAKYGSSIAGWYIPTEPAQVNVATPARAAQFGRYLGAVSDYLHTHDGKKPVMVSPSMPTAISAGLSAQQFVTEMAPLIAASHVDVVNLQDGFEMTAWTPAQEAAAFASAKKQTDAAHAQLWAAVYTPLRDGNGAVPVSKLTPYLRALGALGIPLTEWEFTSYMAPDTSLPNGAAMSQNYAAYKAYLGLR